MTSKIIVNTIEADTGISSVTFASNINLQNDSSVLVSSSGVRLGTGSTIAAPSANEITLSTNSAERLRITSAGNAWYWHNNAMEMMHYCRVEHLRNNNFSGTQAPMIFRFAALQNMTDISHIVIQIYGAWWYCFW